MWKCRSCWKLLWKADVWNRTSETQKIYLSHIDRNVFLCILDERLFFLKNHYSSGLLLPPIECIDSGAAWSQVAPGGDPKITSWPVNPRNYKDLPQNPSSISYEMLQANFANFASGALRLSPWENVWLWPMWPRPNAWWYKASCPAPVTQKKRWCHP